MSVSLVRSAAANSRQRLKMLDPQRTAIVAPSAYYAIANPSLPIIRRIVGPTPHGRTSRRLDAELPRAPDVHLANRPDRLRLPNLDVEPPKE